MFYLEPLAGKCQLTQKPDTDFDQHVAYTVLKNDSYTRKRLTSHAILKSEKAVALERNGRAKCPHRTIQ